MVMSFAILVGMSAVAGIFLAVNLAYFAVLSVAEIKQSDAVAMVCVFKKKILSVVVDRNKYIMCKYVVLQTFAKQTLGPFQHLMPFLVRLYVEEFCKTEVFLSVAYC
jgi:hypothetical protein